MPILNKIRDYELNRYYTYIKNSQVPIYYYPQCYIPILL